MPAPDSTVEAVFLAPVTQHTRRVDIFEADGTTPWMLGAPLIDGSVTCDYGRDERRAFDITLDNSDGSISYDPDGFWYDKVIKIFRGVQYMKNKQVLENVNLVTNPKFSATVATEIRRNLATNPSFEDGSTTGWSRWVGSGGTTANVLSVETAGAGAHSGSKYGRLTFGAVPTDGGGFTYDLGGTGAPVLSGPIMFSAYIRPSVALNVRGQWQFYVDTTPSTGGSGDVIACPANQWTRIYALATPAATDNHIQVRFYINGTGITATGQTLEVDDLLIEYAEALFPYFDGNTPVDPETGWWHAWNSTANASASLLLGNNVSSGNMKQYNTNPGAVTSAGNLRILFKGGNQTLFAFQYSEDIACAPGDYFSGRFQMRVVQGTADVAALPRLGAYSSSPAYISSIAGGSVVTIPKTGEWTEIVMPSLSAAPANSASVRMMLYVDSLPPAGTIIEVRKTLVEKEAQAGVNPPVYFDGDTSDTSLANYEWTGTANASSSNRYAITAEREVASWETQIGEFCIDKINEGNFPRTVKVSGRDYVKRLMTSKFVAATMFNAGASLDATINSIASAGGIPATKRLIPPTGQTLGRDFIFDRGTERWKAMNEMATAYGYELYFTAEGILVMAEIQDPSTSPLMYTFETGEFGNLADYGKSVNDGRLYNHVVVSGEASDVVPVWAEARNDNPSSPTNIARIGDRLYQYVSSFITTTAQAQNVANKFLAIHALEEYELNFSSLMLPWLDVGSIIEFIDPRPYVNQPDRFLLSTLTIPLTLGPMTGTGKRVTVVG